MCRVRHLLIASIVSAMLAATAGAVEMKQLLTRDSMPGWEEKGGTNGLWTIKDGVLECKGSKEAAGWFGSKEDYTDFIIEFEFKLPPGGNSGVFLRTPLTGDRTHNGMEIQILEDYADEYKNLEPGQYCGSLYKIAPAEKRVTKKAGEWNRMRITADADHIQVILNGETIVDANGESHPEILKRHKKGPVGFQDHTTNVWFRDITFADLAADRAARSQWWRDAKFGMFIHWGIYSVLGEGEWIMKVKEIPSPEYEKLAPQFNPTDFNAEAWVGLAKKAGMKYMVITSKHHDGFAMYDSKVSDYDIIDSTPYKKDPMKPLADECKKQDIRFGFYHSVLDWHHPDYVPAPPWDTKARENHKPDFDKYVAYMQEQVRELCTNYGPLACLWWDGGWDHTSRDDKVKFAKVNAMARELQPGILINNRTNNAEDFDTPEQFIPPTGITNADGSPKLWENCITLTTGHGSHPPAAWWGYDKNEKEFKTPEFCIRMLVDIVSKGGNLLLNVGPDPTGKIGPEESKVLLRMGDWLTKNGEAIYGTTASPFKSLPFYGKATVKDTKLYLHVFNWPGDSRLVVPGLKNKILKARFLAAKEPETLKAEKAGRDWIIELPQNAPDNIACVIVLELDGPPDVEPFMIRPNADGIIMLPAVHAEIRATHGQRARFEESNDQVHIGNWTNEKDQVAWQFETTGEATYEISAIYAADTASAGGKYAVSIAGTDLESEVKPTASATTFQVHPAGSIKLTAGVQTLTLKPLSIPKDAPLMNLREVLLTPKK